MKKIFQTLLFVLSVFPLILEAQSTYIRRGTLDLRQWDFYQQSYVRLHGEWEFFMSELIAPDTLADTSIPKDYVVFPSTWNEVSKALRPGNGYATYHVKVLVKAPQSLALEIPHFYSSYSLWINKKLIARNGRVGMFEDQSQPQWLPQTVTFHADQETLDIVIQVSNFHHAKGGVREDILLGAPAELLFKRQIAVTSNVILITSLILTALSFFVIYLFIKKEISSFYFAMLCLTWAIRVSFSNLYLGIYLFPDFPWEICVKIEYITLYLTMIWAIFFLSSLFPDDVNNLFKYFLLACNLIFIFFTLISKAILYTQFLPVYLSFCLILLIYIVYVLVRAFIKERPGVWLILSSIMLGVIIFAYDLVSYQGLAEFDPIITNFGYLAIFILMAVCLIYQLRFLKPTSGPTDILRYEDLYKVSRK